MMILAMFSLIVFIPGVSAVENSPPAIDSIVVSPENPTKYQTMTCTVEVSDTDGNLDYVDFSWYKNGVLERESTKVVYGTDDTAYDVLEIAKEPWDYIVCQARVYDFERAYDYSSHAVRVGNMVSNSAPSVSYVDITPRHPNPQQDLTCSVFATDADDNLDYVIIEWYRNDRLIRSAAKDIQGSSDTAYDVLSAGYTYPNDWIKCKATAYDSYAAKDAKDSLPVLISGEAYPPTPPYPPQPPYGQKPVAILSVDDYYPDEDDMVRFSGYGSYDPDGGSITQYLFDFGDGTQSAWLPAATPYAYHAYANDGVYYARLMVKDDEQVESDWSGAVAIRVGENGYDGGEDNPEIDDMSLTKEAYEDYVNFECKVEAFDRDEDLDYVRFKWYVNGELTSTYKNYISGRSDETTSDMNIMVSDDDVIKCEATVYDQEHNSVSASRSTSGYAEGTTCSLAVKRFDYYSYLMEGSNGWVETEIENTGTTSRTLTVKLYVDGSLKDEYTTHLRYGDTVVKRFEFPLSVGTHKIRMEAYLPCADKINKTTEITLFPLKGTVFIPSTPNATTPPSGEVSVIITPASLDIEADAGGTVSLQFYAPQKTKFSIAVEGLPDAWASYPREVEVEGSGTAFVYIVPKAVGNYDFKVKANTTSKMFEQAIMLYVAPKSQDKGAADGMTGLISGMGGNWLIGAAIVAALVLLVALYFFAGRLKKKKYEERFYGSPAPQNYGGYPPYYGQRPAPKMMKGSVKSGVGNAAEKNTAKSEKAPVETPIEVPKAHRSIDLSRLLPAEIVRYQDGTCYPKVGGDFVWK